MTINVKDLENNIVIITFAASKTQIYGYSGKQGILIF